MRRPRGQRGLNAPPRCARRWHALCCTCLYTKRRTKDGFLPRLSCTRPGPAAHRGRLARKRGLRAGRGADGAGSARAGAGRRADRRRTPCVDPSVRRRSLGSATGAALRAPGGLRHARRGAATPPVAGGAVRGERQHRHRRRAHHGRLPGACARAGGQRHRRAAPARCRRAVARQDQPGPVRHRAGRHAVTLRPPGQHRRP